MDKPTMERAKIIFVEDSIEQSLYRKPTDINSGYATNGY